MLCSRSYVNSSRSKGSSLAELLVGLPILLMLGLGALQLGLWFHARNALSSAVFEAARAAAAGHAQESALHKGFSRGIAPWLYGATSAFEMEQAVVKARMHLQAAQTLGWFNVRIVSPMAESFDDWAVPARDSLGHLIDGVVEIPNDNLRTLSKLKQPASGVEGDVQGMQIGSVSKQTLSDANVLKLHGHYGVPLNVPLIGPLVAATMRMVYGCTAKKKQRLGVLSFDVAHTEPGQAWQCSYYAAVDTDGKTKPRMPMELAATVRMQSPARRNDLMASRINEPSLIATLGAGTVETPELGAHQPVQVTQPRNRAEWERDLATLPDQSQLMPPRTDGGRGGVGGDSSGSLPPSTEVPQATPPNIITPPASGGGTTTENEMTPGVGGLCGNNS